MKRFGKLAIGALMCGGAALAFATPAAARAHFGISFGFGFPGYASFGPCDYYDYYDAAPPWGLPPDYCDDNVYFQPIFWDGEWYRGPIYYRWEHGRRVFWLNGGWRRAEWRHHGHYNIHWRERGREHFRHFHGGYRHHHGRYYHHEYGHEHHGHRHGYEHVRFSHEHHGGHEGTHHEHGHEHGGHHHGNHDHGDHHDHRGHF